MLRRIEPDDRSAARPPLATDAAENVVPAIAEGDIDATRLPPDHPSWVRDAIAVSARARQLVARLKPAVVAVLSLWDHRLRSIVVGGRRVSVDPSGSYRADA